MKASDHLLHPRLGVTSLGGGGSAALDPALSARS